LAQVFRPGTGFNIIIADGPQSLVDSYIEASERFENHWENIIARLKMTGHREGIETPEKPGWWLIKIDGNRYANIPVLRIRYTIIGDTLTIKVIG
jgi:hypothetical protein